LEELSHHSVNITKISANDKIIIECEEINSALYAYDILFFNNIMTDKNFEDRYNLLKEISPV